MLKFRQKVNLVYTTYTFWKNERLTFNSGIIEEIV